MKTRILNLLQYFVIKIRQPLITYMFSVKHFPSWRSVGELLSSLAGLNSTRSKESELKSQRNMKPKLSAHM